MGAAKTSFGHAETAAGAVGISRAFARIRNDSLPEFIHLRTLNGYVSNILESQAKQPTGRKMKTNLQLRSSRASSNLFLALL